MKPPYPLRCRLAQACQHLRPVSFHDVYQEFTYVSHAGQPLPLTALMLAVVGSLAVNQPR